MLHLRIYGPAGVLTDVAQRLEERGDLSRSVVAEGVRPRHGLLTAEIVPGSTDAVLEYLDGRVPPEDVTIARLDEIGLAAPGRTSRALSGPTCSDSRTATPDPSRAISSLWQWPG